MIIPHRKPCIESQIRVKGDLEELNYILNDLLAFKKELTVLPSGNSAINIASKIVSRLNINSKTLIPDMGGWKGFEIYSKLNGLKIEEIETDLGIINIETLVEKLKDNDIKSIFLTSLAGYLAPQPLKEIKKVCMENEVIFIEDISGKIGGDSGYGDIIVCSTGSPKIINCEYGGFLGISKELIEKMKENNIKEDIKNILKTYKVQNIYGSLKEESLRSKKTYRMCNNFSKILKDNIENAYFKDLEGISVFVECETPKDIVKNVEKNLKLDNGKSLFTLCPLYERIFKKGFVIEVKKMDVLKMEYSDIDGISLVLNKFLNG
ncbi:conserved hypothetical protein [Methanococcus vannielii SB]|uniref:DegT/DnrJ/EryC1/StrS aminotransferase n=1 Tax=Methanococcus vannielii (strain ATCC 35089 / DSM 1224 / JCM 13029 / OCM 148 / SB) TaxID=406327 RepID=A6UQZ6_METVS|nr:hypothetical protein [Methanococcus vannielii]ABR54918.1 conserved hypothetical protein [Methanococcus vannielii SB]